MRASRGSSLRAAAENELSQLEAKLGLGSTPAPTTVRQVMAECGVVMEQLAAAKSAPPTPYVTELIGEPTGFRVLRMHPGHVAVHIDVHGEAAGPGHHGGQRGCATLHHDAKVQAAPHVRQRLEWHETRQVRVGAGALVLAGVLLGSLAHPGFFVLAGFVGAGLVFAGLTDWCGMGLLLAKAPWNQRPAL